MYPVWVEVLGILNLVGLSILGFLFYRERKALRELFPKSGERDIRNKLKEVLDSLDELSRQNQVLNKNFRILVKDSLDHTQKSAILRYNPYQDTGGDQSFSVCLLDGKMNGLILTSLHSRSGTRVYIRKVENGKSEIDLSKEERKVLDNAISQ